MSNPNSFEVALPVRQLPDGTVRVGHELPPQSHDPFAFPVVPNESDDNSGNEGHSGFNGQG